MELQHLVRGIPAGEAEHLRQITEPTAGLGRPGCGTSYLGPPAARPNEPARDLDQRRLARTVGSEQPDELYLGHLEVNSFQRLDPPVALLKTTHGQRGGRSEEHTSELQSRPHLVCRLLL